MTVTHYWGCTIYMYFMLFLTLPLLCDVSIRQEKMYLLEKALSMHSGGSGIYPSSSSYYSMTVNGKYFRGERPWGLRWDLFKDVFNFKDKKVLDLGCCIGLVGTFLAKFKEIKYATGVDAPDELLKQQGSPFKLVAARLIAEAFEVTDKVEYIQIDFNKDINYEHKIGFDYDVVFCMSLFNWIYDKQRFLNYLASFQHIIYEGHDNNEIEIERFKSIGFTQYAILGKVDKNRTIIYFSKD